VRARLADSLAVKGSIVRHRAHLPLLLALLLAPSLALASGYALPNSNPRDLSMCASAVAAQRDSGAAFALPAALARLEGFSVSLGGGAVNVFDTWTDPSPGATQPPSLAPGVSAPPPEPGTASLAGNPTPFPNASFAWGGKLDFLGGRGFGAGISVQPFGGTRIAWPSGWAGRYRILDVDRRVFSAIGSVGLEIIPQIRIGGGAIYYFTTEKVNQNVWQEPYGGLPVAPFAPGFPDAQGFLSLDGHAWSYDVSIEIDPVQGLPLTFGVDYKHQGVQNLTGNVQFSNVAPVFSAPVLPAQLRPLQALFQSTRASHQLTIPNTLNVGAAYRVAKPWLVTLTYTWDQWSVYKSDVFVSNTGASITVPRNYGDGNTLRAGVEWDALRQLQVRAGVERDWSGLNTAFYSPTLPDSSSWAGSIGGSYWFGRGISVSLAFFYAHLDKVTSTNNGFEPGFFPAAASPTNPLGLVPQPTGTFRGSYEPWAIIYTASVGWTPGAAARQ
jgi:long-chain fatty acid transport protein